MRNETNTPCSVATLAADAYLQALRGFTKERAGEAFFDYLKLRKRPFCEPLHWELLTARTLTELRRQLTKNDCDTVEEICLYLLQTPHRKPRWHDYPMTATFLIALVNRSVAERRPGWEKLPNVVKLAEELYDHFVSTSALARLPAQSKDPRGPGNPWIPDFRHLALEIGLNLEKHRDPGTANGAEWRSAFLQFKRRYSGAMNRLRYHYFGVGPDDPIHLYQALRELWDEKTRASGHSVASEIPDVGYPEEDLPDQERRFSQDNVVKTGFGNLDPRLFDHPVFLDAARIVPVVREFFNTLRHLTGESKGHAEPHFQAFNQFVLANEFRLCQWELHTRDVGKEQFTREVFFFPSVDLAEGAAIGSLSGPFQDALLRQSWLLQAEWLPTEGGYPRYRRAAADAYLEGAPEALDEILKGAALARSGFRAFVANLGTLLPLFYKEAYIDFLEAHGRKDRPSRIGFENATVIEDGELAIFSLVWGLRSAASDARRTHLLATWCGYDTAGRLPDDSETSRYLAQAALQVQLPALFDPTSIKVGPFANDLLGTQCFNLVGPVEFCVALGLILFPNKERCVKTRRWRSFIGWMARTRVSLLAHDPTQGPAPAFPAKRRNWPGDGDTQALADALSEILTGPALGDYLMFLFL